ncbi:hypothetical protein CYMTET_28178 [Cymbomonas tetramitiformis]|uniref:2',3'-cyclic-nucleotide 3'-phosphodiesterase n=1 Tax=Cymbomonas tetramitiformis TaxID=36881 RepID=A0AAE0FNE8_9CHLO|nr:hypothetical protein CYMTET_28178 [Cymbomonas tetramitiformis]
MAVFKGTETEAEHINLTQEGTRSEVNVSSVNFETQEPLVFSAKGSSHEVESGYISLSNHEETNEETKSSTRLRTAADVVHRIMWDEKLRKHMNNFTIGYTDRFVGILEEPFDKFEWEDMARVGISTRVLVPKHRIEYFKFAGRLVWDKRKRVDHVFGSGNVDGEPLIAQLVRMQSEIEEKEVESCPSTSDTPSATFHVAVPKPRPGMKSRPAMSKPILRHTAPPRSLGSPPRWRFPSPPSPATISQAPGGGSDELANADIPADVRREPMVPDEGLPDCAAVVEARLSSATLNAADAPAGDDACKARAHAWSGPASGRCVTAPEKTGDEERPTHFISVRVQDAACLEAAHSVQRALVAQRPELAAALLPAAKLHVTIAMVRLETAADEQAAIEALHSAEVRAALQRRLPARCGYRVHGVGCFGGRVLHARLHPVDRAALGEFRRELLKNLAAAHVRVVAERDVFTPHMTLAKLSRAQLRRLGPIESTCFAEWQNHPFGLQAVGGLELARCGAAAIDRDGFYARLCPPVRNAGVRCRGDPPLPEAAAAGDITRRALPPLAATLADTLATPRKCCVILRGVPGSGKSSLTARIVERAEDAGREACVFSADHHLLEPDGTYLYSAARRARAHATCWSRFQAAAAAGTASMLLLDNTNSTRKEYSGYAECAQAHGYTVVVVEMTCCSAGELLAFQARGLHGVSEEAVTRMRIHWESDPAAWLVDSADLRGLCPRDRPEPARAGRQQETHAVSRSGTDQADGAGESTPALVRGHAGGAGSKNASLEQIWLGGATDRAREVTEIFLFDFDMTLAVTYGTEQGQMKWEQRHDTPWPQDRDWLNSPESLQLPGGVAPGPGLPLWVESTGHKAGLAAVVTGRRGTEGDAMAAAVHAALASIVPPSTITPDRVLLRSPDTQLTTAEAKVAHLDALLKEHLACRHVSVVDDDVLCLQAYERYSEELAAASPGRAPQITVHSSGALGAKHRQRSVRAAGCQLPSHIPTGSAQHPPPGDQVHSFLYARGLLRASRRERCAAAVVALLEEAWCKELLALDPDLRTHHPPSSTASAPATGIVHPFGSHCLGRVGDLDLCLLAPANCPADWCVKRLQTVLRQRGMTPESMHAAPSARCPCLRLRFEFLHSPPLEADIVFAPVLPPGAQPAEVAEAVSRCLAPVTFSEVSRCTAPEAITTSGIGYMNFILDTLAHSKGCSVPVASFAMVVETLTALLRAAGVKGNEFHCVRSFQLVEVARAAVENEISSAGFRGHGEDVAACHGRVISSEDLFAKVVRFAAAQPAEYWEDVCQTAEVASERLCEARQVMGFVAEWLEAGCMPRSAGTATQTNATCTTSASSRKACDGCDEFLLDDLEEALREWGAQRVGTTYVETKILASPALGAEAVWGLRSFLCGRRVPTLLRELVEIEGISIRPAAVKSSEGVPVLVGFSMSCSEHHDGVKMSKAIELLSTELKSLIDSANTRFNACRKEQRSAHSSSDVCHFEIIMHDSDSKGKFQQ